MKDASGRKRPTGLIFPDPAGRLACPVVSFRRSTLRPWTPPLSAHLAFQLGRVRDAGCLDQNARVAEPPGDRQAPGSP